MKRLRDMTPEELDSLPVHEKYKRITITTTEMLEQYRDIVDRPLKLGDTIHIRKPEKLLAGPSHAKDPVFWIGSDGRPWQAVRTEQSWKRTPYPF